MSSEKKKKMKRKEFDKGLRPLHVELVKMQEWVKARSDQGLPAQELVRRKVCLPIQKCSSSTDDRACETEIGQTERRVLAETIIYESCVIFSMG